MQFTVSREATSIAYSSPIIVQLAEGISFVGFISALWRKGGRGTQYRKKRAESIALLELKKGETHSSRESGSVAAALQNIFFRRTVTY